MTLRILAHNHLHASNLMFYLSDSVTRPSPPQQPQSKARLTKISMARVKHARPVDDRDSSPSLGINSPPRGRSRARARAPREWTPFEMTTVLSLLCKGVHRTAGGALTFATELNEALNPGGPSRAAYARDVPVADVEALLGRLAVEKKAALAFIERTPPLKITRAKRRVFERDIGFDGSLREWNDGRRERERELLPERLAGLVEQQKRDEEAAKERGLARHLDYDGMACCLSVVRVTKADSRDGC